MFHFFNFPTWLTFFRIFLSPCIVQAIYSHRWIQAAIIFSFAMITDFFDGYYARLYKQETQFGALLDAVADKILIFSTLAALFYFSDKKIIPAWFVVVVLAKDIVLVIGAVFLLLRKKYKIIPPSTISKWFTALLMLFFLYSMFIEHQIVSSYYIDWCIQLFVVMIIIISYDYVLKFFKAL